MERLKQKRWTCSDLFLKVFGNIFRGLKNELMVAMGQGVGEG